MSRFGFRKLVGSRRPVCAMDAMDAEPIIYNFMKKPSCELGGSQDSSKTSPLPHTQTAPGPRPTTAHSQSSRSSASSRSSQSLSYSDSSSDNEADDPAPLAPSTPTAAQSSEPSAGPSTIPPAPPLPSYIPGMPHPGLSKPTSYSRPAISMKSPNSSLRRRRPSAPQPSTSGSPREYDSEDSSSVTAKTTHNISIRSPSSSELTNRLSRLSSRMPRPTPIHIQSIKIELGDGKVYDNFEDAVEAIRATDLEPATPSHAHVTVVAVGEGVWGSEVGRWVQDRSAPDAPIVLVDGDVSSPSSSSSSSNEHPIPHPALRRSTSLRIADLHDARAMIVPELFPRQQDDTIVAATRLTCSVCMTEQDTERMFFRASDKCEHGARVCKACLARWIKSNLENHGSTYIVCPDSGCGEPLDFTDVRRALIENNDTVATTASEEQGEHGEDVEETSQPQTIDPDTLRVWERYEKKCLRNYLSSLEGFVWCLSPACEGGQIHDVTSGPAMTCVSCGFKTCAEHQVPWHEGLSCQAYDRRFSRHRNEERIFRVAIKFLGVKDCPSCGVNVQKNGGCDHMRCTHCRAEFCYRCRKNYEGPQGIWAMGKNAHSVGCRHYWGRVPWSRW